MFRLLTSLAIAFTLLLGNASAGDKPVHGTVAKVEKEKDTVVVTVNIVDKKKKDAAATETKNEKKYTLPATTKVEKLTGKKDNITRSDAKLDDLKEGQTITLTLAGDKVEKVEIQVKKSK